MTVWSDRSDQQEQGPERGQKKIPVSVYSTENTMEKVAKKAVFLDEIDTGKKRFLASSPHPKHQKLHSSAVTSTEPRPDLPGLGAVLEHVCVFYHLICIMFY